MIKKASAFLTIFSLVALALFSLFSASSPSVYAGQTVLVANAAALETAAHDFPRDIYLFDDNLGEHTFSWDWSTTIHEASEGESYSGWRSFVIDHQPWGGIGLQTTMVNSAEQYDAVSFWMHGGPVGGQQIRVFLIDRATAYNSQTYFVYPQANTWTKVEIPIADLEDPPAFDGIVFSEYGGSDVANDQFYLDEVKFVAVEQTAVWVYSDTLNSNVVATSTVSAGTTVSESHNTTVYSGTNAIEVAYTNGTDAYTLDFSEQLHTNGLQSFYLALHGGSTGGQEIVVSLAKSGAVYNQSGYTLTLQANQWVTSEITMSDFNWPGFFDQIEIAPANGTAGSLNNPFYIDNMLFKLAAGPSPVTGLSENILFEDSLTAGYEMTASVGTSFVLTDGETADSSPYAIEVNYPQSGTFSINQLLTVTNTLRDYEALQFDIKGDSSISQNVDIFIGPDSTYFNLNEYDELADVPQDWTEITLSLDDDLGAPSRIGAIKWAEGLSAETPGKIWLDNVRLLGRVPQFSAADYISNITFPSTNDSYEASLQTSLAQVPISGTIIGDNINQIVVNFSRNGALYDQVSQAINYASGTPTFSMTVPITNDGSTYDFQLIAEHASGSAITVSEAFTVTAIAPRNLETDYGFPSDVYVFDDSLGSNFFQWHWSTNSYGADDTESYRGWRSFEIDHQSYGGVGLQSNNTYALTDYDTLSFWMHGGTEGGQRIRVYLINGSEAYTSVVYEVNPEIGTWTKVEIPIADLGNPAEFDGLVFFDLSGTDVGSDQFYVDDIKFEAVERDVVWVYSDYLNEDVVDSSTVVSGAAVTEGHTATVYSGTRSIALSYAQANSSYDIQFDDQLHTNGLQSLHLAFHGGDSGGQDIEIALTQDGSPYAGSSSTLTLQANQWMTYEIPLSDLGWVGFFDGLEISAANGSVTTLNNLFYVDNIIFELASGPSPLSGLPENILFDDALASNLSMTGAVGTSYVLTDGETAESSAYAIEVTYPQSGSFALDHAYNGVYDLRDYDTLQFQIKGNAAISQSIDLYLWANDSYSNTNSYYEMAEVPNGWTIVNLSLDEVFNAPSRFSRVQWSDSLTETGSGVVLLDEVKLLGRAPEFLGSDYISVTSFPVDEQLYIRDSQTNLSQVSISGTVIGDNIDNVVVDIYQDGAYLSHVSETVAYVGDSFAFSFTVPITAGEYLYHFALRAEHASGVSITAAEAFSVTAGDEPVLGSDVISMDQFPSNGEVISRDLQTYFGHVPISGTLILTGADEIQLEIYENDALWQTITETISYDMSDTPNFSLTVPISDENKAYMFQFSVLYEGETLPVISATNVTVNGEYPFDTVFPEDIHLVDDGLGRDTFFTYGWSGVTADSFATDTVYDGWGSYGLDYASNYGGYAFRMTTTPTIGIYDSLSFWVHGGTEGGQLFRVYLALNADGYTDDAVWFAPQADLWTHIEIPFSNFSDPMGEFNEVIIQDLAGNKAPIFIDNMRIMAEVPESVWVYQDGLNSAVVETDRVIGSPGVTYTTAQSNTVYDGSAALELVFENLAGGYAIEFYDQLHSDMIDGVTFEAHGGTGGAQQVGVYLAQDGVAYPTTLYTLTLAADTWANYDISIDDFGWPGFFNEIQFVALSDDAQTLGQPLFIDDIRLDLNEKTPPPTGDLREVIYDDALASGWSAVALTAPTTTVSTTDGDAVNGSSYAISGAIGDAEDGISLSFNNRYTYSSNDYSSLQFALKGDVGIDQDIEVQLYSNGATIVSATYLLESISDSWVTYTIPLDEFQSPVWFDEIRWVEKTGDGAPYGTIWLDNVQLNGANPQLHIDSFLTLDAAPQDLQLYPRNLQTNVAHVPISGTIIGSGVSEIGVRVARDGTPIGTYSQTVSYAGGTPTFAFSVPITAELITYDFELYIVRFGVESVLSTATKVVAGDAYIINGQSNAVASVVFSNETHNFDADLKQWVRAFGDTTSNEGLSIADNNWYVGNESTGETNSGRASPASVGQWGMKLGISLTQQTGIPVAILNGSHPGRAVDFFVPELAGRNSYDDDDYDTAWNYGRLYRRASAAGLQDNIRAIFWYQGEANYNDTGEDYFNEWDQLYDLWVRDYPSFEQIYVLQVRDSDQSCAGLEHGDLAEIQEVHRTLGDFYDKVTPISTNGIDGHDGCHYFYTNGYELVGNRTYEIAATDLYSISLPTGEANLHGPNLAYAYWGNEAQTEIVLVTRRDDDVLVVEPGAEDYIYVEGQMITVTQVLTDGNQITLTLESPPASASNDGLSYYGLATSGPWVRNSRGIGMLAFSSVTLWDEPPSVVTPTIWFSMTESNQMKWSWDIYGENCEHNLYNGADPYNPDSLTSLDLRTRSYTADLPNTAGGDFYWLEIVGCESGVVTSSKHGAFTFGLEPGN